jgi:phosphoglucomutase
MSALCVDNSEKQKDLRIMTADLSIFKAYDIRGIVGKTLTEDVVRDIGRVLGTMAKEKRVDSICVGRDGRLSGLALSTKLMEGIISAGVNVKNIGMVPTPVLYFATKHFGNGSGVAVTGSHNPPDYNGLKMMLAGLTLFGAEIQGIGARVNAGDWKIAETPGVIEEVDALTPYMDKIINDVKLARSMKVAVDAGNGVAGPTAVRLLKALGCELVELYTDINGHFPNHHPDPSKLANLVDLQAALAAGDAEVGIAFDGDGDRLGVVTRDGNVIFPDRQMMLFSADILEKHPGAQIVYDVKCTRRLIPWVKEHGGEPVISCTGHSLVKAKLRETGALFAGEMSGHLFFNDGRWPGFDDGVYAGMRLLEVLSRTENPSAALNALPSAYNTPELQIPVAEGENKEIVAKLQATLSFPDAARTITIDGVRTEWEDGFALVRASNTTPVLVLRFEGDTPEALERIKQTFMQAVSQVVPGLAIPQ